NGSGPCDSSVPLECISLREDENANNSSGPSVGNLIQEKPQDETEKTDAKDDEKRNEPSFSELLKSIKSSNPRKRKAESGEPSSSDKQED
ncbi:jg25932, partial [Pararge aegeria aegeria]